MNMTREELIELFPEMELIQDKTLKEQTIRTWLKVCEACEWESLTDIPFSGKFTADPDNLVYHTRMTTLFSHAIAVQSNAYMETKVNVDYVVAGALLHDVCKPIEYSPKGGKSAWGKQITHSVYGICVAREEGMPLEILHIIASHTKLMGIPNQSLEAIIVHQCDDLAAANAYLISLDMVKSMKDGSWIKR